MGKWAGIVVVALSGIAAAGCGGCGGGSAYCDVACDCGRCSDRDYNICLDDYDYDTDLADRRGCSPEWDDYAACVEDIGSCREPHNGCSPEWDRYHRCVD